MQRASTTFEDRTLRQIVSTTIGGTSARLRLANQFGTEPLTVRNVHVARSTGGSNVDTRTDRAVTFGGTGEITIPAGGAAVSDPVEFEVPALGNVAISFHLPGTSGAATIHGLANRDNYVAGGDQAAGGSLSGARKAGSYYFLAGLDVVNDRAAGSLVAFGASITDGYGTTFGANRGWPQLLARRIADSGRTVGVLNTGISGNKLTREGSGESATTRFQRDVLHQPGVRWVIISDTALNDLGDPDPPPPAELTAALQQLVALAQGSGITVLCSTLTPYQGAGYWNESGERGRTAYNDFVRSPDSGCDGVLDQAAITQDQATPSRFAGTYDSGDHLHPNEAGLKAIADAVDLSIFD
ncbi:hypothetical protein Ari01nite_06050 [Paractinoplanes rishiriensis]|uniref:SGNH hydrolase-type esterase domain-containing protein n=1 Tax=Paractinoplanes rishiriensis TaxID=1050105 RepID=A0A919MV11_9ACTN|nr:hypothetical protein Ari01nite_06050 [Actinoplanes rishiriensis]